MTESDESLKPTEEQFLNLDQNPYLQPPFGPFISQVSDLTTLPINLLQKLLVVVPNLYFNQPELFGQAETQNSADLTKSLLNLGENSQVWRAIKKRLSIGNRALTGLKELSQKLSTVDHWAEYLIYISENYFEDGNIKELSKENYTLNPTENYYFWSSHQTPLPNPPDRIIGSPQFKSSSIMADKSRRKL